MKIKLFLIGVLCNTSILIAQNYEFGKVSLEEVTNRECRIDSFAKAMILYNYRDTYLDYENPEEGMIVVTEIHKRIKILNINGLDYANEKISLYRKGKRHERITKLKAITYGLKDGKLATKKMKSSAIYKNKVSENWEELSFTLPEVKVGSVIEWKYKLKSPFFKIDDLIIQEDIPTICYFAKIQMFTEYVFNRLIKGNFNLTPKEYSEPRSWSTAFSIVQGRENVHEYELKNIPALKKEPYVDNIDNYRFSILYELASTFSEENGYKEYSATWDEVIASINKSDKFGKQLITSIFLRNLIDSIRGKSSSEYDLMINGFNYIKNHMMWNDLYGKYTVKGIKKAYNEKVGNVSEINLALVLFLRELGIKANPVLTSTRSHGVPVFPTIEGFNYVVACAEIGGKQVLMDATEKNSVPGILPTRVLNWDGTIVYGDGSSKKISLYPKKKSANNANMSITIAEDGSVTGKQNSSYSSLEALGFRNTNINLSNEEYLESKMNSLGLDNISAFERKNFYNLEKPVIESYEFKIDQGVDIINGDLYFSPLFFLQLGSNPFKLEERTFPVDFVYPFSKRKMVNIKLPVGYEVKSVPKPLSIALPNNLGAYTYNIQETAGSINVMVKIDVNSAVIKAENYPELKEFYKQRVLKETEKIVLVKK